MPQICHLSHDRVQLSLPYKQIYRQMAAAVSRPNIRSWRIQSTGRGRLLMQAGMCCMQKLIICTESGRYTVQCRVHGRVGHSRICDLRCNRLCSTLLLLMTGMLEVCNQHRLGWISLSLYHASSAASDQHLLSSIFVLPRIMLGCQYPDCNHLAHRSVRLYPALFTSLLKQIHITTQVGPLGLLAFL